MERSHEGSRRGHEKNKTQPRNAEAERKAITQKETSEKRGTQTCNAFTLNQEEVAESEEIEESAITLKDLLMAPGARAVLIAMAETEDDDNLIDTLRLKLTTARDRMHAAMIELSATCRAYNQHGPGDGLDIIKDEINFDLFGEHHSTWWTDDPLDDEDI